VLARALTNGASWASSRSVRLARSPAGNSLVIRMRTDVGGRVGPLCDTTLRSPSAAPATLTASASACAACCGLLKLGDELVAPRFVPVVWLRV